MNIKRITNSYFQENTYILKYKNKFFIIDPGSDIEQILFELKDQKIDYILLTHGHMDHFFSSKKLSEIYKCPIYASSKDTKYINGEIILDYYFDRNNYNFKFNDYNEFNFNGIKIFSTPGHSKGSVCILIEDENILFSGDTLFKESFGRFDFKDGNFNELKNSINYLFTLNEDIKIYPGHGEFTTIKDEKRDNIIKFY